MQYRLNKPGVLQESFEGEDVIINLDTGIYFLLNPLGSVIFELLEKGTTNADILTCCSNYYGSMGEDQILEIDNLIQEIISEGIVVRREKDDEIDFTSLDTESIFAGRERTYQSPVLHKFTDMQELLLLDPVHEVDERGWPYAAKDLETHDT